MFAPEVVVVGQVAIFEESDTAIDFEAREDTNFFLASSVKHLHELVLGYYSAHTNRAALAKGEARITEIDQQLQGRGRLRVR